MTHYLRLLPLLIFTEGNYIWMDGTTYNSNNINNQDCGALVTYSSNRWADMPCDATYKVFICNRDKTIFEYNDYIGINTHNDDDSTLTHIVIRIMVQI